MEFKGTITLGEMLQTLAFLVAVFMTYNKISLQITKVETKLQPIYEWWQACVNISAREYVNKYRMHARVEDEET